MSYRKYKLTEEGVRRLTKTDAQDDIGQILILADTPHGISKARIKIELISTTILYPETEGAPQHARIAKNLSAMLRAMVEQSLIELAA